MKLKIGITQEVWTLKISSQIPTIHSNIKVESSFILINNYRKRVRFISEIQLYCYFTIEHYESTSLISKFEIFAQVFSQLRYVTFCSLEIDNARSCYRSIYSSKVFWANRECPLPAHSIFNLIISNLNLLS